VLVEHLKQTLTPQLVRGRGRYPRRARYHFFGQQYGAPPASLLWPPA
jgi:hypothetical protein